MENFQRAECLGENRAPVIEVRDLCKIFKSKEGKVEALKDVSLEIYEKEFVSIVGRSGCGKTTLLKIVSGLMPRTSGVVSINGKWVTGPQKDVGMVFQTPVLMPWRAVIENVMLPVEILSLDKRKYYLRALELLELAGLKGFEEKAPRALSGGMQQRVSICRALIFDPSFLFMDEPFGALDAMTREEMNLELLRIWREKRKTILFVTHSISEAVFLSDRVVVMTPRPGKVKRIFEINLPPSRGIDIKGDAAFGKYELAIREEIFEAAWCC